VARPTTPPRTPLAEALFAFAAAAYEGGSLVPDFGGIRLRMYDRRGALRLMDLGRSSIPATAKWRQYGEGASLVLELGPIQLPDGTLQPFTAVEALVNALGAEWPCPDNYSHGYHGYDYVCIYVVTAGSKIEIEAHAQIDHRERIYSVEVHVHP